MVLVMGLWTVLTLGFYRFWMKTRLRRWYWSGTRVGGYPLEYVGTPWEKLLGFLFAVVILAFWLGIVNLFLMFFSFTLLSTPGAAYALSTAGLVPLYLFAWYRARRYVLARTRWRSIRLGLEPGAWGYMRRATLGWIGVILTLGISHPAMRFKLEKFVADRTFFGTERLHQGGTIGMLYPAYVHVLIGGLLTLGPVLVAWSEARYGGSSWVFVGGQDVPSILRMLWIGVPWLLFGLIYYSVVGKKLLANQLTAGGLGLEANPSVARMTQIVVLGNLARIGAFVFLVLVFAFGILFLGLALAGLS
ncbi:MAG: DUF898 family protein, partial [Shimia sp.]